MDLSGWVRIYILVGIILKIMLVFLKIVVLSFKFWDIKEELVVCSKLTGCGRWSVE